MKRRKFLAGMTVPAIGSLSGCVDISIDEILGNDTNDENENGRNETNESEEGENQIPNEAIYFGEDEQFNIRIFDPTVEYRITKRQFVYNGTPYQFEQFGTLTSVEMLKPRLVSRLEDREILPDSKISVEDKDVDLSDASNINIRSQFTVNRFGSTGIVIEYILETDGNTVTSSPDVELSNILQNTPHSASMTVQYEQRTYRCVIPIMVQVIVR